MSTITLSKATIDTFKKMYEVNQSLKLVEGEKVLKSKSTDRSLVCHAPIDEEFPRDFHIYNLKEFLSVVSVVHDPEVDFSNDNFVEIRSKDGKQKLRYQESEPEFVTSYVEKDINMPDIDFSVTVTGDDFTSVMKAAGIMRLEYVGFLSDGETVSLTAFNRQNGNEQLTNQFAVSAGESSDVFSMFYKTDMQNVSVLLGEGDLTFEVSSRKISKVSTETGKTFWVAMNASSKYGE